MQISAGGLPARQEDHELADQEVQREAHHEQRDHPGPGHLVATAPRGAEPAGAGQLAVAVQPVLDTVTDTVTTGVVEPVTGLVADTAVGATNVVTGTTSTLLGLTASH